MLPLKNGLKAFKGAIKSLNPTQIKAAFGMAKGLGIMFKEIIDNFPGNMIVAVQLVKDLAGALGHLATNVGGQIFQIFISTVRSPLDFVNWVKSYKSFQRACKVATRPPSLEYMYANEGGFGVGKWALAGTLAFMVGTAQAGTSCDLAFEMAYRQADDVFSSFSASVKTQKLQEFTEAIAKIEKDIRIDDGFTNLVLAEDAYKGIANMIKHGRNPTNVRGVMRDIVRCDLCDPVLTNADKNRLINKYFTVLNDVDNLPVDAVSNRLWGDLGKYAGHPNFMRGSFNQLEFMDDLKNARITVESLEKGFGFKKTVNGVDGHVQRYVDIIADGRHFEVKNFIAYSTKNTKAVTEGLEKELGRVVKDLSEGATRAEQYITELDKIHFVFRGGPDGSLSMLKKMKESGSKILDTIDNPRIKEQVKTHFQKKIDEVINAANAGKTKLIPKEGDLVVFQGKSVPY